MRTLLTFVLAMGFGSSAFLGGQPPANPKDKPKEQTAKTDAKAEPVEVTELMKEYNSPKFDAPPKEFKVGKATPKKLDEKAVAKTADGFKIKLPAGAPIPTPTIYKGKIYASGGFHSKEYYCFDANTGKF